MTPVTYAQLDTCFDAAKNEFAASNITILKTSRMIAQGDMKGYLVELDGDGYSILKQHSIEEF